MPNLFTQPPRLPLIAPSILSADFMHMGEECRHILEAGADVLHLDVMDGHFVPNLTMGPDMCRGLRKEVPTAFLDVHLMVEEPERFVGPFVEAGANHVTFHIEVMDEAAARGLAGEVRRRGVSVGLAINPDTGVDAIAGVVEDFDLILVMSVHPGFSGQKFIAKVLDKTRAIRRVLRPDQRLQMDGGISPANITDVRDAGCDTIVAASAIFGRSRDERAGVIGALRGSK